MPGGGGAGVPLRDPLDPSMYKGEGARLLPLDPPIYKGYCSIMIYKTDGIKIIFLSI